MPILDYLGRPVNTSVLTEELAEPKLGSMRPVFFESIADSLTPEALGTVLAGVDQNDILSYLTLAEEMEERDLHYRSVISTRKLAVSGLPVRITAATDDAKHVKEAEFLSAMLTTDKISRLMAEQLDALGKGYSVNEIIWDQSGSLWEIAEFKWRDPRHFQFDMETMSEIKLRSEENPADGVELEPYKYVVHEPQLKTGFTIRNGLARLAAVAYMCKSYTIKDWMAFAETFGMPLRVGKYQSSATAAQKSALLQAVTQIGIDAACIIPDSMMIELVERGSGSNSGGEALFEGLANWLDSQVSKGVLGQTMTTDDGSSMSQAQVHQKVREDIKVSDTAQLRATLQRDVIKPVIDLNFGGRLEAEYPRIEIVIEEPEDLESLSRSLPPFIELGLPVETSVILDKFGLDQPEEGAELLAPVSRAGASPLVDSPEPDLNSEVRRRNIKSSMVAELREVLQHKETPSDEAARAHSKLAMKLYAAVRRGDTLTPDQRVFLAATAAATPPGDTADEIDRLAQDHLKGWKKIMDPILQPILSHAKDSDGYEDFLAGLEKVMAEVDSSEARDSIALADFKARGLGDGTDDVD